MILQIIKSFNWVDIVVFAVMIRAVYIGIKRGFTDEVLHFLGVLVAIFVIFHYYPACTSFLESKIFFKSSMASSLAYLFLWITVSIVAKISRIGILALFKVEARSLVNKIGGVLIAVARGLLVCSLLLWFLLTTGSEYFSKNIRSSYSGSRIIKIAPIFYQETFKWVIVKYFPKERINEAVLMKNKDSSKSKK